MRIAQISRMTSLTSFYDVNVRNKKSEKAEKIRKKKIVVIGEHSLLGGRSPNNQLVSSINSCTFPIVVIVGRKWVGDNVLVRRGNFFSMNLPCFQIYELFRKKSEVKKTKKKKKSDKTSQRFAKILARFTNKKSPTSNRHRQLTKSVRKFYVELSCVECTYTSTKKYR